MKRPKLLIALGLLVLCYGLSLLHVFNPFRDAGTNTAPRVTIRFGHWQLETGLREAFDVAAKRYMELNPDVRVEQLAVPGVVYRQWLSTQLAGGTVPDLVSFNSTDPSMVAQIPRHFEVITRWLDEPNPYNVGTPLAGVPWRETFIDRGRNRSTYLDQFRNYFAVGLSSHTMRMFYNRDLLKEITGRDEPPRNFREWLELGEKVRAHRPGLIHVAGSRDFLVWLMPSLVNQSLSRWIGRHDYGLRFAATSFDFFGDQLEGEWDLRSPPMQQALQIARAFGGEMPSGFLQTDRNSALQTFLRGEALCVPSGTWDYPTMRATARFAIGGYRLPLPTNDDPTYGGQALLPVSDGGASTALPFYLTRQSAHKAEAIDFLRFMTGMEGNLLFSEASHWMPSVEGVPIAPEMEPFKQVTGGYIATDAQNGPILMVGPGADYARLFETHFHVLYAPDGGVEAFTRAIEGQLTASVRQDLQRQLGVTRGTLRQRDTALGAQWFLGPAEQADVLRQTSGQHLVEVQAALLAQRLETTQP
jgi:ABC-type glycerol-3-phosphate transport system substrate-binding protein